MSIIEYNNPKKSLILFELDENLDFLIKLYLKKKFPKNLMISGQKGIGKSTLVNHFMNYVYDKDNYDLKSKSINSQTLFYGQYLKNIFSNIIYLAGDNFKNIKIDDIRDLKIKLSQSTISNKERFIILDDIELFNINSLNALLKMIEEPSSKNYFILINNKTRPLVETIKSRSLELKIILSNKKRVQIIESLIKKNNLEVHIDFRAINLSPRDFLCFNDIIIQHDIKINNNLLDNIEKIINLYKKNKSIDLINMILFLTDYYFYNLGKNKNNSIETLNKNKYFIIDNINKFVTYNLNQSSLINCITNKLSDG